MQFDQFKRREFITLLGGAAAWPLAARAQQQGLPVVGLLWVASERVVKPYEESIRAGLRDLGWVDGGNYRLEVCYGNGEATRLPGLIEELIPLDPKVLSGISEVATLMKAKTSTIPIVLSLSYDPVESGFAQTLARPGGNITGVAVHYDEVLTKHVEIASELVPGLSRIGFINDAADPSAARFDALAEKAARRKGLTLVPMPVRDRASVEAAYAGQGAESPGALIVMLSGRLFNLRDPIREGALKLRAPVVYPFEGFVEAGGLVSYGPNYTGQLGSIQTVAPSFGVELRPVDVRDAGEIERAVTAFARSPNGGLKTAKSLGLELVLVRRLHRQIGRPRACDRHSRPLGIE